jgi:hypothetical protein
VKLSGVSPEAIRDLLAHLPPCAHRREYVDACDRAATHLDARDEAYCDAHKASGIRSRPVPYADLVRLLEKKVFHLLRPVAQETHTPDANFGYSMHEDGRWYILTRQRARDAGYVGNPGGPFDEEDEAVREIRRLDSAIKKAHAVAT